ncbi:MAG: HAMP domain-containing sensor histidine kinase [Brevundimonas sp.]
MSSGTAWARKPWSVRVRSAVAAMLVVLFALTVAGLGVVYVVRESVTSAALATAQSRASDVVAELEADGHVTDGLNLDPGPNRDTVVTILDGGRVVAQTNLTTAADPAVAELPVDGVTGVDRVRVAQGYAAGRETVRDVQQALAVGIPVLVLIVGWLTYVLAGRALRPVEEIRRRSAHISHGDLAARIDVPATGDEIERLAVTLNEMLDRLDQAHRAQAQFVADASHELRTPLAAMRAELDAATRDGDVGEGTAERVLGANLRMQGIVDDLLALARTRDGDVARQVDVDVDAVVESVGYAAAATAGAAIAVEVQTVPARMTGNPAELSRAVQNLVDNAIRWADHRVRVQVTTAPGRVVIDVDDDGPGIPPERRDVVFERFVRLDESRSRTSGGAGLGLAIVRAIADAHGGTVTCTSSPLGGARLRLVLPAFAAPPDEPDEPDEGAPDDQASDAIR